MYTCGFRINVNLVKEGSFRINAKLVKEELNRDQRKLNNHLKKIKCIRTYCLLYTFFYIEVNIAVLKSS